MLQATDLYFSYKEPIIKRVSLELAAGELLVILGPNGAGKSTLVRLLAGLLSPQQGTIQLATRPLNSYSRREIARYIGYVAQETKVEFPLTALEFVLQSRFSHSAGWGFEQPQDLEIAQQAMNLTDTFPFSNRPINALSGGERQRVFLARALAQQPKLLILDEPTANLDIAHQVATVKLLRKLAQEQQLAILLITHELNLAAQVASRILLMQSGEVVICDTPTKVLQKEILERVFQIPLLIDQHPKSGLPRVTVDFYLSE